MFAKRGIDGAQVQNKFPLCNRTVVDHVIIHCNMFEKWERDGVQVQSRFLVCNRTVDDDVIIRCTVVFLLLHCNCLSPGILSPTYETFNDAHVTSWHTYSSSNSITSVNFQVWYGQDIIHIHIHIHIYFKFS